MDKSYYKSQQFNRLKIKLKCFLNILIIILIITISVPLESFASNDNQLYQITISQKSDSHEDAKIKIDEKTVIDENAFSKIDFSNLEFADLDISTVFTVPENITNLEELYTYVRTIMLSNGYAKIIDEDKASKEELKSQKEAKKDKIGIWSDEYINEHLSDNEDNVNNSNDKNEFWNWCKTALSNDWVTGLLGLIPFGAIIVFIINRVRKKKKMILVAGDKASGKTTLQQAILYPTMNKNDLIDRTPTRSDNTKLYVRDLNNKKFPLYVNIMDYPGDENHKVIDFLSSSFIKRFKKYEIVLILSPTKSNKEPCKIDEQYIQEQEYTIKKLWAGLLKSKRIIKPNHFYLYINKKDLFPYEDLEMLFEKHIYYLKEACRTKRIHFNLQVGSIVERDGIHKIIENIKEN